MIQRQWIKLETLRYYRHLHISQGYDLMRQVPNLDVHDKVILGHGMRIQHRRLRTDNDHHAVRPDNGKGVIYSDLSIRQWIKCATRASCQQQAYACR